MSANIPYRARPRQSDRRQQPVSRDYMNAAEALFGKHSCNPDYPCPACRPPSMLPDDATALDRMMRGNRAGGLQVVSYANWSWKPPRRRRTRS